MGTDRSNSPDSDAPHVLAVDDEVAIHGVLERLLPREGIQVTTCTGGEKALELLEEASAEASSSREAPAVDLALIDAQLPGLGGLELLDRITDAHPQVQVVFLSTQDNVQQAVRAMREGAADYIPKPFSTDELVERLKRILEEKRKLQAQRRGAGAATASGEGPVSSNSSNGTVSSNGTAASKNAASKGTASKNTASDDAPDGISGDGTPANGTPANGTPANGTAVNDTSVNGAAAKGEAPSGTAHNGTAHNGTTPNGTAPNGTALADSDAHDPDTVEFVGQHQRVQELREMVGRIADSRAPVFVQGESGTGKEILSRLVHERSPRSGGPYVPVNCAALPTDLVESHLFGHVEGAFTGAVDDTVGAFERADGGTILLDEITEITPSVQAKLLRVLQTQQFQRVGSSETKSVDVRVIATSNREMEEALQEGTFREDLYHRLAVFPLRVPPLRARLSDIPLLAEHFIEKYAAQYDLPTKTLAPGLLRRFQAYSWPGNVRELENVIHRGVVMAGTRTCIEETDVTGRFFADRPAEGGDEGPARNGEVVSRLVAGGSVPTIEEMERKLILSTLSRENVSQKEAAEKLGISARTIRNKLQQYRDQGFSV